MGAVYKSRKKIRRLLNRFQEEPFLPNLERGDRMEEELIDNCIWITNVQSTTYWVMGAVSISSAVTFYLFLRIMRTDYRDWQFPFGEFTLLNVTYSPNYEFSLFYQALSTTTVGYSFATIDVLMASLMAHISTQFKILQNNFRNIVERSSEIERSCSTVSSTKMNTETRGSIAKWKYLKKSLSDAVKYHIAIEYVVNEMEEIFSTLLLLVMLATLPILCLCLYRASQIPITDLRSISSFVNVFCACSQILWVCYWGEQVMQESANVGRAAYESQFVGEDAKFQRAIALVMRKCQCSSKITAGGFSNLCLATFAWILRSSYSAYMVLLNNFAK